MTEIILIHGYKGGSGKTITSLNLANILSTNYRVLLVEADTIGPQYTHIFHNAEPDTFFNQYLEGGPKSLNSYIYSKICNFDIVFASPKFDTDDFLSKQNYQELLKRAGEIRMELINSNYDYVLFDQSPGFTFPSITSILIANTIILIQRADRNSFDETNHLLKNIYENITSFHEKNFHIFVNQIPDHPHIGNIVSEWEIMFQNRYDYISSFTRFPYAKETSFNSIRQGLLLPKEDPTLNLLVEFAKKHLILL